MFSHLPSLVTLLLSTAFPSFHLSTSRQDAHGARQTLHKSFIATDFSFLLQWTLVEGTEPILFHSNFFLVGKLSEVITIEKNSSRPWDYLLEAKRVRSLLLSCILNISWQSLKNPQQINNNKLLLLFFSFIVESGRKWRLVESFEIVLIWHCMDMNSALKTRWLVVKSLKLH